MKKNYAWLILSVVTSISLLGCGSDTAPKAESSKTQLQSSPQPTQRASADAVTTDARAAVGSVVVVGDNELRLYVHPTFPRSRYHSIRGDVRIPSITTTSAPLLVSRSGEYLSAFFPTKLSPPFEAVFSLVANGYLPAETTVTVAALMGKPGAEDKSVPLVANMDRKELHKFMNHELGRLEEAIASGNLTFASQSAKVIQSALDSFALQSPQDIEAALQDSLRQVYDAATSISLARRTNNVEMAAEAAKAMRDVIETQVGKYTPH